MCGAACSAERGSRDGYFIFPVGVIELSDMLLRPVVNKLYLGFSYSRKMKDAVLRVLLGGLSGKYLLIVLSHIGCSRTSAVPARTLVVNFSEEYET